MFDKIQNKLVIVFQAIIVVMFVFSLVLALVFNNITSSYQSLVTTTVKINEISELSQFYLESYAAAIRNIDNTEKLTAYEDAKAKLEAGLAELDLLINSDSSRIYLAGLNNLIKKIIETGDEGIESAKKFDIVNAFRAYDDLSRITFFVNGDVADLLTRQLEQTSLIHRDLESFRSVMTVLFSLVSVLLIISTFYLSIRFAKSISDPLEILAQNSHDFGENLKNDSLVSMVNRRDEIGVLARAFKEMQSKIISFVEVKEKGKAEIESKNHELERVNAEISKMNKLIINREFVMIELKKRIAELESQLRQN